MKVVKIDSNVILSNLRSKNVHNNLFHKKPHTIRDWFKSYTFFKILIVFQSQTKFCEKRLLYIFSFHFWISQSIQLFWLFNFEMNFFLNHSKFPIDIFFKLSFICYNPNRKFCIQPVSKKIQYQNTFIWSKEKKISSKKQWRFLFGPEFRSRVRIRR